jgi:murein DD-endopeptidase MepM/ murein hydrolase activator NlpD
MNRSTGKYVTIMLVPDGTEPRTGWRVRAWQLKAMVIGLAALVVGIVLFFLFYGGIVSRAAMTQNVIEENEDLKRYYYKVQLLEANLKQAREIVSRMTKLAGIDFQFPELPNDSALFAKMSAPAPAVLNRSSAGDITMPGGMPIDGFVSQPFNVVDSMHYHPGVDIACAVGTPVLATASGTVETVVNDSVYGHMVTIQHNDSVSTVYAHNSQILVEPGQKVVVGSRVALSGNSGRSTAPHLHYEIRVHGKPINPLDNPYEKDEH